MRGGEREGRRCNGEEGRGGEKGEGGERRIVHPLAAQYPILPAI
jgi:hypothetical protein